MTQSPIKQVDPRDLVKCKDCNNPNAVRKTEGKLVLVDCPKCGAIYIERN